jgi:5-methylcytosine-specific restriction protein A
MPSTKGHGNPDWTREETILALGVLASRGMKCPAKSSDEVGELSEFLRNCAIHPPHARNARFRNRDGVYMKMQNLLSCDLPPDRKGLVTTRMDRAVWHEFVRKPEAVIAAALAIRANLRTLETLEKVEPLEIADDDDGSEEGKIAFRTHRRRERARGLRKKALKNARRNGNCLRCEACGQTERSALGMAAEAEFEVHHRIPLAESGSSPVKTRLKDLAVVCASCHRLVHALMRVQAIHVPIDRLAELLQSDRATSRA